jgi:Zinc-binding domain of primase-helicase
MSISVDEIKRLAVGRWPEILSSVGGIDRAILDRRNHACPRCGGRDRFRMIDEDKGALFCNQCFNEKNGDGIAAVQWMLDCDFKEALRQVAEYLGIDSKPTKKPFGEIVATYDYCDYDGAILFQVVRMEPKGFRQRKPVGSGWSWSVKGVKQVPYRFDHLVQVSDIDRTVYIVEGEKDVDRLLSLDFCKIETEIGKTGQFE